MARRRSRKKRYARRSEPERSFRIGIARPDLLRRFRFMRRILDEKDILRGYRRDIKTRNYYKIPQKVVTRRVRYKWNRITLKRFRRYIPYLQVCERRRSRREVMFAKRQTGKGAGSPRRFTRDSKVRCS